MVDEKKDNHIDHSRVNRPSWEVPLLLLSAFRELIDQAHVLLAERGHPHLRPVHMFALRAVGDGATASETADRLGVTKQAAAKTIAGLESLGYITRKTHDADARRKAIVRTERGEEVMAASAAALATVVDRWADEIGPQRIDELHETLLALDPGGSLRLDLAAWSS